MRSTNEQRCYYCGSKNWVSKEHTPPDCMFDAVKNVPGYRPIKVTSCEEHNGRKSNDDKKFVYAMVLMLKNSSHRFPIDGFVEKTVQKIAPNLRDITTQVPQGPIVGQDLDWLNIQFPYLDEKPLEMWIRQITAGLVFHGKGYKFDDSIIWDNTIIWSSNFYYGDRPPGIPGMNNIIEQINRNVGIRTAYERLAWYKGWYKGYHPDIYSFDVNIEGTFITFRHIFFKSVIWYATLNASPLTVETIKAKLTTALPAAI